MIWVTTVIMAPALVAAITATITGQTQKLIDRLPKPGSSTSSGVSPSRTAEPPLLIVKATADTSEDAGGTWAAAGKIRLTKAAIAQWQKEMATEGGTDGYSRFILGLGAVTAHGMVIDLKMSTLTSQQVRLERVRMAKTCTDPLSGTLFFNPPAGGPGRPGEIGFDLDQQVPIAQEVRLENDFPEFTGRDFFRTHIQYFTKNDGYVYHVIVHTRKHYCTFRLLLDVTGDYRSETITVDDHGEPFRVTGVYMTTDTHGFPIEKFRAYKKVYATAASGSHGPDWWNEEDPKTFKPYGP
ncbi:hypothetical protein [Actinomadura sp. DC4]|uniref:hypothetical protein n=1 Tax=Actinomadura sp. DC4 TaxID=3055069 RepID=UPI0025B09B86|nr:hypothetical protein [Actinomadura sp. DC4]MDN3359025.1 hypothetical protein [Actinomadura sp. DC4]